MYGVVRGVYCLSLVMQSILLVFKAILAVRPCTFTEQMVQCKYCEPLVNLKSFFSCCLVSGQRAFEQKSSRNDLNYTVPVVHERF